MDMKPRSASGSKPRINLINPHTGHFSPKPDVPEEEEFLHEISDEDSQFHELKPDPLTLIMGGHGGNMSPMSGGDSSEHGDGDDDQFSETRRRGGRLRDPVWRSFHSIGGKTWQCNDCSYSLIRPQADRMRKHRIKCQNLVGHTIPGECRDGGGGGGGVGLNIPNNSGQSTSKEGASSSSGHENTGKSFSTATASSTSTIPGMSQFKTNSITRELKRIADALEESNKLKKLKLGLDPHIPFDGGSKHRK